MFTSADAQRLRDSLPAIDFFRPAANDDLTRRYFDFYGLDLATPSLPLKHAFGYFNSGPFRIACHYFAVPDERQIGTAFLLHGYYDHVGLYTHLIRSCLQANRSVVIFDLPGHGLSSGHPASIDSFQQYHRALQDCLVLAQSQGLKKPWSLIGQSTGAAVIINHLLSRIQSEWARFDRYILLAPLLRPSNWTTSLYTYYLMRWFFRQTRRHFAINSHDQEFLDFLHNSDPLQSRFLRTDWVQALIAYQKDFAAAPSCEEKIHIIQGTEDTTVDWRFNLARLEEKFPNSRIYFIKNARHHLVNESAPYRTEILATINEIFRSNSSG